MTPIDQLLKRAKAIAKLTKLFELSKQKEPLFLFIPVLASRPIR